MSRATPQQRAAIDATGNVLLVAGAGTGKTTTLVQRCLRLILEENVSIDRILMVTFTEAAAAEMRHRIRAELQKQLAAQPDNLHLAEQLALLDTAFISTLHAFCLRLIREHFHELQIDPQLTVLDEQQTRPLVQEVLEELFQNTYVDETARGDAVRELIQLYGRGSDDAVREKVRQLHIFTQSLAQPQAWLAKARAFFAEAQARPWEDILLSGAADWANEWQDIIRETAIDADNLAPLPIHLAALSSKPSVKKLAETLEAIAISDEWKRGTKTKCRKPIEAFFEDAAFLRSLLPDDSGNPLLTDWQEASRPMCALLELTQDFTESYRQAKRDLGGVDFTDLEQLALQLLIDADSQPTEVARLWQYRLDHVFVDECQDINAAQDAIIRAVSRTEDASNRFMVGDVKQSIYRFRLANPHIFQNYEHDWKQQRANHQVLPLTENFRSREGVLTLVNSLFAFLMRPALGGLHYDQDAALQFGARDARLPLSSAGDPAQATTGIWPEPSPRAELHLVIEDKDSNSDDEWAEMHTVEREAKVIAHRLRELHDGAHQIWDKETNAFRAVRWSDMAILMRSAAGKAEQFVRACHDAGVPLLAERSGFFTAIEVMDLVNLLRLLDNPLQDIPLLAVLRSPLVGLSLDELAFIRAARQKDCYWLALHQWHRNHKDATDARTTWQRVDTFLAQHAVWRSLIRQTSLSCCLDRILNETHYEAFILTTERGEERVANVKRLLDLARRYDPYQRQGLFRFLQFVDAQEEVEHDLEPAQPRHPDAVQLLTVHKSKGLEFPVVVLAGIGGLFNQQSLNGDIFWSEDFGLAPRIVLGESEQRYPSIAHWVIRRREQREMLGEEQRLLYVALTRARDTLILSGKGSHKLLGERWGEAGVSPARINFEMRKARSFYDWLKLWLRESTKDSDWQGDTEGANPWLRWKLHTSAETLTPLVDTNPETADVSSASTELSKEFTENLDWSYPYPAATIETAKTSVTALRRRRDETDDEARQFIQFQFQFHIPKPRTERRTKLSATDVGLAHHTFLQHVDLEQTGSLKSLQEEIARLTEDRLLSDEEARALDLKALAEFWSSKIGSNIARHSQQAHRELPFTARFSAADMALCDVSGVNASLPPDEFVVVQGVIDLAVIQPKEIWLLDFKTDHVRDEEMTAKLAQYGPQLRLYALALERIYQRPVRHRWLHWLYLGETVEI